MQLYIFSCSLRAHTALCLVGRLAERAFATNPPSKRNAFHCDLSERCSPPGLKLHRSVVDRFTGSTESIATHRLLSVRPPSSMRENLHRVMLAAILIARAGNTLERPLFGHVVYATHTKLLILSFEINASNIDID